MNSMRISGLSSGMDIDTMVSKLMSANRIPYNKLLQKKQTMEWQRDDYRNINSKILELRNASFNMKLSTSYTARNAASSDEASVSVNATSAATEGIYSVQVLQLAKAAALTSGKTGAANSDAKLASLGFTGSTTLSISGEKGTSTITVNSTDTISETVRNINNQSLMTGVKVSYDDNLQTFFFVSTNTGKDSRINLKSNDSVLLSNVFKLAGTTANSSKGQTVTGTQNFDRGLGQLIDEKLTSEQTFRITYKGQDYDYKVNKDTTIGSLIQSINNSALGKDPLGVSAYLDSTGKLAFNNPDNPEDPLDPTANDVSAFTFSNQPSGSVNIVDKLGLAAPTVVSDLNFSEIEDTGKNSEIKFNNVTGYFATNTVMINGISITAKAVQTSASTITVNQDTDSVVKSIKDFVTKYNEIIDLINSKMDEKRYRDYLPLTEDQKKDMKEDDIKRWEEKAKSGMLHNDDLLTSAIGSLRGALTSTVQGLPSGDIRSLADIGIISSSWTDRGKLYIDETKLRKAVSEKPDQVLNLFTADDGIADSNLGDGLAVRLYNQANAIINKLQDKAGTTSSVQSSYKMGKQISDIEKDMDAMSKRLESLESRYYNQFTAMEKYLNQMSAQSAWLTQQFGGKA